MDPEDYHFKFRIVILGNFINNYKYNYEQIFF